MAAVSTSDSGRVAAAAAWPDLERQIVSHRARIIVELDAASRESRTVAAAERVAPEAVVYLVGPGLGPPDYRPRVCVIDATPTDAVAHFTNGTIDSGPRRGASALGSEAALEWRHPP